MNFALHTLGCKLNQLEGEALADAFQKAGFTLATQGPGIIIINTCTVTSKADQKCRRLIRKALRDNPDSCVIVTGCYANLDPAEIAALEDEGGVRRLFVAGGGQGGPTKSDLLDLPAYIHETMARSPNIALLKILEEYINHGATRRNEDPRTKTSVFLRGFSSFDFQPEAFTFHSRGYLKIQDGCDNACAYCRVHLARGPSVSLPPEDALERLRLCEERGCPELMITGVNITQYRYSDVDFAGLLAYLLEGSATIALRLSSLEPEAIDERLASVLAHPRIRPHFHLSVQSGSDAVLGAMGRAYTAQTVEHAAALLRGVKDNPFLAGDIIAGFPGETESDFAQTRALCDRINFAWIHAFPFSPRPGTPAFTLKNSVCERDITRRVEALTQLALQGRRRYAQSWIGRELSAVVEKGPANQCRAVAENYLKLIISDAGELQPGTVIRCIPVSLCEDADGEKPDAVAKYGEE